MSADDERVIELSKGKIVLMIVGSLLFVAAGAWFLVALLRSSFPLLTLQTLRRLPFTFGQAVNV